MNRDSSYVDRRRVLAQKDLGACRSCGAANRSSCRSLWCGTHSAQLGIYKAVYAWSEYGGLNISAGLRDKRG